METPKYTEPKGLDGLLRANSWKDLFPSFEAEMTDYLALVTRAEDRFTRNNTLLYHHITRNTKNFDGDTHVLAYQGYNETTFTTYQKKSDGNVQIQFGNRNSEADLADCLITPEIGYISHPYTAVNTVMPDGDALFDLYKSSNEYGFLSQYCGNDLFALIGCLAGVPATRGWETQFTYMQALPVRIGHLIYDASMLHSQDLLLKARPDLFPKK